MFYIQFYLHLPLAVSFRKFIRVRLPFLCLLAFFSADGDRYREI